MKNTYLSKRVIGGRNLQITVRGGLSDKNELKNEKVTVQRIKLYQNISLWRAWNIIQNL